jgi:hypothetical protein
LAVFGVVDFTSLRVKIKKLTAVHCGPQHHTTTTTTATAITMRLGSA